ncbi:MAG: elongation factor P [Clostridia bacterium]|jgi:elongation factor P|nr:elongation factor P [Clostridia bacterium]MDD4275408.1 elongation factor P [Clostridia bacterium]
MISAGEFRKGVTFEMEGNVFTIVEFMHVKPGKGSPFVRTKVRNVMTGQQLEKTFNPADKFEPAIIDTKEMQYLYNDGDIYYFMDNETYEQLPLNREIVEDALNFVKDGMSVTVKLFKDVPFSVEAPTFVVLQIIECEPGIQGDTSRSGNKPATLETGYKIGVPLFVNNGDKIRVDTRTGEYVDRA